MILRGNHARFNRWCFETYGDSLPVRWLKDHLFDLTMHYYERHLPAEW